MAVTVNGRQTFRVKWRGRTVARLPLVGGRTVKTISTADGVGASAVSPDHVLAVDPGTDTMVDLDDVRAHRGLLVDVDGRRVYATFDDIYREASVRRPVQLGRWRRARL